MIRDGRTLKRLERVARTRQSLFIALLEALLRRNPGAREIHVVLDNYVIHKGRQVQAWMRDRGKRIRLHFLPPYCPNENRIERVWLDLHANVTRNHTRRCLRWLMDDVRKWIRRRNANVVASARRAA